MSRGPTPEHGTAARHAMLRHVCVCICTACVSAMRHAPWASSAVLGFGRCAPVDGRPRCAHSVRYRGHRQQNSSARTGYICDACATSYSILSLRASWWLPAPRRGLLRRLLATYPSWKRSRSLAPVRSSRRACILALTQYEVLALSLSRSTRRWRSSHRRSGGHGRAPRPRKRFRHGLPASLLGCAAARGPRASRALGRFRRGPLGLPPGRPSASSSRCCRASSAPSAARF